MTGPDAPSPPTILVVDDESAVREVATLALESAGYAVVTASTGEEALEVLADPARQIDLVVLDLSMPGLGGEGTFQALATSHPGLPVILCSGYAREETAGHLDAEGLAGFLHKPFRVADLIGEARRVLGTTDPA